MAGAGAIRAGRAFVEIFADSSPLLRGLKQAQGQLTRFGADIGKVGLAFSGLGAAINAPLALAIKQFGDTGDSLYEMSIRTGVSVESLSELGYAVEQTGGTIVDLDRNLYLMGQFISRAAVAAHGADNTLASLGLTFKDIVDLNNEQRFLLFAEAIDRINDAAQRSQLARNIFGRGARNILTLLANGSKSIDEMRQRFRQRGLTISTADATAADDFHDTLADIVSIANKAVFSIGAQLAPVVGDLLKRYLKASQGLLKFISTNTKFIQKIALVSTAVAAFGVALIGVSASIIFFGAAFGTLASAFSAFIAGLGIVVSFIGAMLSPLGILGLTLTALAYQFVDFGKVTRNALDGIKNHLGPLFDSIKKFLKGIDQSLRSGDVSGAVDILFAGLAVAFNTGSLAIKKIWNDLWSGMVDFALKSLTGFVASIPDIIASIPKAFEEIIKAGPQTTGQAQKENTLAKNFALNQLHQDELAEIEKERLKWVGDPKNKLKNPEKDIELQKKLSDIRENFAKRRNFIREGAAEERKSITQRISELQAQSDAQIAAAEQLLVNSKEKLESLLTTAIELSKLPSGEGSSGADRIRNLIKDTEQQLAENLARIQGPSSPGAITGISPGTTRELRIRLKRLEADLKSELRRSDREESIGRLSDRIQAGAGGFINQASKNTSQGAFVLTNTLGLQANAGDRVINALEEIRDNTEELVNKDTGGGPIE